MKILTMAPVGRPVSARHEKRSLNQSLPSPATRFSGTLLQDLPYVVDFSAPVMSESVNAVGEVLQMMSLKKKMTGDTGSIKLVINSPGGSVIDGFKLIGQIKQLDTPVDTIVMGMAASMGAVLALAAASPGRRFMDRYSQIMIHQPSVSKMGGTSEEILNYGKEIQRTRNIIDALIARHTGQPISKIQSMTSKDSFIAPLQALKEGFVDFVMMGGNKGLNKESIKNLKEEDILRRDQFNDYDDLPTVVIDAKPQSPARSGGSGRGGGGASLAKLLGRADDSDLAGKSRPAPVTSAPIAKPTAPSSGFRHRLEIIA